jgi:hypothetical protein
VQEKITKNTLLKPLACRYHSLTLFNVDLRDRSNINKIATASLHTKGNIFTNSRCPASPLHFIHSSFAARMGVLVCVASGVVRANACVALFVRVV